MIAPLFRMVRDATSSRTSSIPFCFGLLAFVIAVFMFPPVVLPMAALALVLLFRGAALPLEELLFWALVIPTLFSVRDFSHLHVEVGGMRLWITEIFLASIMMLLMTHQDLPDRLSKISESSSIHLAIILFIGYGAINTLMTSYDFMVAMRDFAIFYYAAFFYVAAALSFTPGFPKRFFIILLVAIPITAFIRLMMQATGMGGGTLEYLSGHDLFITCFVILTLPLLYLLPWKMILGGVLILASCAPLISHRRTSIAAMILGFSFLMMIYWRKLAKGFLKSKLLLVGCAFLIFLGGLALTSSAFRETLSKMIERLQSGTVGYTDDGTYRFRMDAWTEAADRLERHPTLGEGGGRPFVFFDTASQSVISDDVRPHNTYFTILYKYGTVGLMLLLAILMTFYLDCYSIYHRLERGVQKSVFWGLMASHGAMVLYGFFNLMLESPFLAIFFWTNISMIYTLPHSLSREQARRAAQAGALLSPEATR